MIEVDQLNPKHWANYSEKAHLICFKEKMSCDWDRIDFALVVRSNDQLMGYVTCREHDHESIYWAYGGAFPGTRESSLTYAGYREFVSWCKKSYKRITTLIANDNLVMLKMAMKVGFKIVGVRVFKNIIYLEHLLEFSDV